MSATNPSHYPCANPKCNAVLLPAFDAMLIPPHTRPRYVHHVVDDSIPGFCVQCLGGHYTVVAPTTAPRGAGHRD